MTGVRIGTVLSLPGAAYAELVARHLDFAWIDLEHAALGPAEMQDAIVGVQAAGAEALVRIPDAGRMSPILDAGADGVVLPRVTSAAQVERAVSSMRHPPDGTRGYGPRRLAIWPALKPPACVAQIEDPAGVRAASEVARVDGVTALVVGAADLSFELGDPLAFDTSAMTTAVEAVRCAAAEAGVRFGVAGAPLDVALRMGAQLILHASDIRLIDTALQAASAEAREAQVG